MGLYFYWGWGIGLNLSNTVQLITIISFTAGLVKYLIVQPLQVAITALKEAVTDMKNITAREVKVYEWKFTPYYMGDYFMYSNPDIPVDKK